MSNISEGKKDRIYDVEERWGEAGLQNYTSFDSSKASDVRSASAWDDGSRAPRSSKHSKEPLPSRPCELDVVLIHGSTQSDMIPDPILAGDGWASGAVLLQRFDHDQHTSRGRGSVYKI